MCKFESLCSLVCRFQSFRCFRTITTVFLLDPAVKLLKAGEQRGLILREEDRWLLLLAAAAVLLTLIASQGDIEPSWLW